MMPSARAPPELYGRLPLRSALAQQAINSLIANREPAPA